MVVMMHASMVQMGMIRANAVAGETSPHATAGQKQHVRGLVSGRLHADVGPRSHMGGRRRTSIVSCELSCRSHREFVALVMGNATGVLDARVPGGIDAAEFLVVVRGPHVKHAETVLGRNVGDNTSHRMRAFCRGILFYALGGFRRRGEAERCTDDHESNPRIEHAVAPEDLSQPTTRDEHRKLIRCDGRLAATQIKTQTTSIRAGKTAK
jgi:hypothetical protein